MVQVAFHWHDFEPLKRWQVKVIQRWHDEDDTEEE